jgi:hypothetical protein
MLMLFISDDQDRTGSDWTGLSSLIYHEDRRHSTVDSWFKVAWSKNFSHCIFFGGGVGVPAKSLCRLYIICTAQCSFHCYKATLYMKVYLGLVPVFTYSGYLLKDTVVYVLFVVNYNGCMCEV